MHLLCSTHVLDQDSDSEAGINKGTLSRPQDRSFSSHWLSISIIVYYWFHIDVPTDADDWTLTIGHGSNQDIYLQRFLMFPDSKWSHNQIPPCFTLLAILLGGFWNFENSDMLFSSFPCQYSIQSFIRYALIDVRL
ncbi:hypothetical protein ABKN59_007593 [Abortiporus biennis]